MNDLALNDDKRMTVMEVAEALGYNPRTIQLKVKELFPEIVEERQTTYLNEAQVTAVKMSCEKKFAASTDLEMMMLDKQVSEWKTRKIEDLQLQLQDKTAALAMAAPKVESFDSLQRSDRSMSITAAAKHFGAHPKTEVFPYLRERGYLTAKDLPTQAALDAGYLATREAEGTDGVFRPVACVLACQLETWRTRVIPQIAAWKAEE